MKRFVLLYAIIISTLTALAQSQSKDDAALVTPCQCIRFTWGAEIGGAIDMSGNDMSTFEFNACFGVKYRWIKMFGIGAGADIMVSNSCRSYPLYFDFKTDFHTLPSLLFLNLKGGVSMNYMEMNSRATGAYLYSGLGVNLARNSKFNSYMTLGYTFIQRPDATDPHPITRPDLHMATIRLGINF